MKRTVLSQLSACLTGIALAWPCIGQEQKITQAESDAAWAKHRAERYAYLESSQQEANKAIQIVMKAWPADQPQFRKRRVATTAAFNDTGKWCQSPWSMASTDVTADPPVLVVCPIAIDTFTELLVALNLALAHFLPAGLARLPTAPEVAAVSSANPASSDAILSYYATRLAGLYTSNSLTIRAPQHCEPQDVAYQAVHGLPLDACAKVAKGTAMKWLGEKNIDQDMLDTLSSGLNDAIYLAVVAHELGHVATIGSEAASEVDEEIQADKFARSVLRGDPETFFMAGEMLEYLNVLWVSMSELKLKTRYHLPPHEDRRASAYAFEWRCVKRSDVNDPKLAKVIEELRLFKMQITPPNFCDRKPK
jgi:hypothetical protein